MAYRPPVKYSQGLKDKATAAAVRNLEVWAEQTANQLSKGGTGGVSLPIAMSDVTGLAAALAAKASLSHTHAPTDITGGTNGDVLTISGGVPVWAPPSGGATPSVTVSYAASSGTHNVSTLGTVDWFIMDSYWDPPGNRAAATTHGKIKGGWIKDSYQWVFGAQPGVPWTNFLGGIGVTMQSSSGDDHYQGSPYNSNIGAYMATSGAAVPISATSTGAGCRFRVPACSTTRTLTALLGHFSCKLRLNAQLADGSASHSVVSDSGSGALATITATVTYTSAYPTELVFTTDVFANYTNNPWFGFGCAYVG